MKIKSDINAKTAMVYGGAAFLLLIVGFRSIIATIGDHVGLMTWLSMAAIVLEFFLLLFYAKSIYDLEPESSGGEGQPSSGKDISNMDSKEIAELTAAVKKVAEMGEGLSNLSSGMVREEIRKEVNDILSKAVSK
ncbi:MAG: hypothetical protein CMG04_03230 [Candidatus Marinimicrobia bacterium]|nr:hypothetical protein [Candidatus Neomarinimicrobiota bacterium]|tara:strand:+ start:407 stop:811 length:405 start_codon:yes stop_codon:yes gene_type:complete